MDYMSSIGGISSLSQRRNVSQALSGTGKNTESFEALFQSALNMVKETNELTKLAEQEEINFAMGYTDNFHDLLVAQQKANISLQYTVAVRNSIMDAYKEIMNLQF